MKNKTTTEKPLCQAADQLLFELGEVAATMEEVNAQVETEIAAIRAKHADEIQYYKGTMGDLEQALTALMKENRDDLFRDKDKVELLHGLLLYARGPHVVIPRDALRRIEEQGWLEAVRIAKSVDRGVVSAWPDERLEVIGARRAIRETYSYELRN